MVYPRGLLTMANNNLGTFGMLIDLPTPFSYSPANDNLLVDVLYQGAISSMLPGAFVASDVSGDNTSRVAAFGVDSPTATYNDTLGLVTAFVVIPVPEPETGRLILLGLLGLLTLRHRRAPVAMEEQGSLTSTAKPLAGQSKNSV